MEMQPEQMQQGAVPAQGQAPLPPPNPDVLSPVVQNHIDELEQMRELMDGKLGNTYDRVLTAGMKTMYAPESAEMLSGLISDDKIPVANKLGEGVANLLIMMDNQGNGTIPKEVIIPVGVALIFEAADYLFEVGVEVTEDDLGKAIELMITGVLTGYGIDPAKMDQIIDDMSKKLGFEEESVEEPQGEEGETASEEVAEPVPAADEEAAFNKGFEAEQTARKGY